MYCHVLPHLLKKLHKKGTSEGELGQVGGATHAVGHRAEMVCKDREVGFLRNFLRADDCQQLCLSWHSAGMELPEQRQDGVVVCLAFFCLSVVAATVCQVRSCGLGPRTAEQQDVFLVLNIAYAIVFLVEAHIWLGSTKKALSLAHVNTPPLSL